MLQANPNLGYRDVQEILFERGSTVTHEAIRQWCLKFGQAYANQLKHRRAQPGDKWHLDEVFLTINGQRHSDPSVRLAPTVMATAIEPGPTVKGKVNG